MKPARRPPTPIRALFFDVDGVLTDGRLFIDDRGREMKVFDTKDGHGIKMAIAAGLTVVWISGRESLATSRRARDLGVEHCLQGVSDKEKLYRQLCRRWSLDPSETAAIGDDEPDVPLLTAAGFSACPSDAAPAALRAAAVVLKSTGGRGAAREFVERVLRKNEIGARRQAGRGRKKADRNTRVNPAARPPTRQ